jgi:hypothetical protein
MSAGQEILMSAVLYNSAVMQNKKAICLTDGRKPMGDNQSGTAMEETFEGLLDQVLCFTVNICRGLI